MAFAFLFPSVLFVLIGLPVLYYLLRVRPPPPRRIVFPPLRLLADVMAHQAHAQTSPWWILVLRMIVAALIIFAAAGPILNPLSHYGHDEGPLIIILDDDWAGAPTWAKRRALAVDYITEAGREGRTIVLMRGSEAGAEGRLMTAEAAAQKLDAITPVSYLSDHEALRAPLQALIARAPHSHVVWISNGVAGFGAEALAGDLTHWLSAGMISLEVISDDQVPPLIVAAENGADGFDVTLQLDPRTIERQGFVRALDAKGRVMARVAFAAHERAIVHVNLALPVELRNDVARLDVEGIHSAGAVALIDAHAHRLRIGLVADEAYDAAQPLLSASYYLTKAVQPFADLRFDRDDVSLAVDHLLRDDAGVMILADVGALSPSTHKNLEDYVQRGGLLLRFAGPHMLAGTDDLLPVRLRRGGRVMGGALSWEQPKHIAAIDPASPLAGVKLDPDVRISRQLLAEPDAGLRAATWLALEDGTPLVSAKNIGRGLIVLVHVSADTTWSNLPLSGMFVEMLRRITEQAHDVSARSGQNDDGARAVDDSAPALAPFRSLDGFGVMGTPPLSAHAIAAHFNGPVSAEHPAGYYGGAEGVKALNALMPDDHIAGMTWAGVGVVAVPLNVPEPRDVRAWLWSAAFAFMLLDALAHLWLNGQLRGGRLAAGFIIGVGVASGVTFGDGQAYAQQNDVLAREREAALETHLAYVLTGDGRVDDISRAGLSALSRALAERTSLQPAAPLGIDVAREELSFYPLLYWPIVAGRPQPSPEAVAHLARFMRQGGTVLFDTRDALSQRAGYVTPEGEWLRRLLAGVDIPPLQIVPADHVITKTFYLLNRFVGRTEVGETWIEALPPQNKMGSAPVRAGDNVSPIMITSNDLAAAWATNAYGAPLYQLIPNDQRQREMALRGGINVVMYTLTGNYKADQVHVHDLLERLGH